MYSKHVVGYDLAVVRKQAVEHQAVGYDQEVWSDQAVGYDQEVWSDQAVYSKQKWG